MAPAYYQPAESDWLKSFTAGFLTTCGLQAVGSPCTDAGEEFPLHGSIANTPSEHVYWYEEKDALVVKAQVRDEVIFGRKLRLDGFVEWKMMGVRDYVLGLECGNCYPDGRDVMRKTGMLKYLEPGEAATYEVKIDIE